MFVTFCCLRRRRRRCRQTSSSYYFIQLIFVHFHSISNSFSGSTTMYNWNDECVSKGVRARERISWYNNNNNNVITIYLYDGFVSITSTSAYFYFFCRSLARPLTLTWYRKELSFQYLRKLKIWPMHSSHATTLVVRLTGNICGIEVKRQSVTHNRRID